jgi:23S rRNA (cytidine1920-2'-O)/16S rRNA (cytidine1409-2'-O)-methyltransferase
VAKRGRTRSGARRPLRSELARLRPDLADPEALIRSGAVLVDGAVRTNPASLVGPGASLVVREERELRGRVKLAAALEAFAIDAAGAVALDAGSSTGGFVQALLAAGARRVYAVDAGYGQLLGSLRQDQRVVNLERTNVGVLDERLVPDPIELITLDLGNLALAEGVPQLEALRIADDARLVALVKPMAELGLAEPPEDEAEVAEAVRRASAGIERSGWRVAGSVDSPITGARGAREAFVHALRDARGARPRSSL